MKKIILTILTIAILISPISASAMTSQNILEKQYEQALIQVINLLMQRVEQLVAELNEIKLQQIPMVNPNREIYSETVIVEIPQEKTKVEYIKPIARPDYNPPTPVDRCHAKGQLDIKVKCK